MRRPSLRHALLLLLGLGMLIRAVRYFLCFPVWGDESFIALNVLDKGYSELTHGLRFEQISPLLFLWAERTMLVLFGTSELSLRFLPLLAGIGSLFLFAALAKRLLPQRAVLFAVGFMAVAYFPIRHSCEIKPYAFDLFFSLALMLLAVAWHQAPQRTGYLLGLMLLVPVALLSSYPSVFIAGAISLMLLPVVLRARSFKVRALYLGYNLLMVATFAGAYWLVGQQQYVDMGAEENVYWRGNFLPAEPARWLPWLLKTHTGDLLAYPVGGPNGGSTLTLLLCVCGVVGLRGAEKRATLALLGIPFLLTLLAAILRRYPYGGHARVAQHLAPAVCLLAAYGISKCLDLLKSERWRQRLAVAIPVLFVMLGVGEIARDLGKPYKTPGDQRCRAVCREVIQKAKPGEVIVVLDAPPRCYPPLEWYLRQHRGPVRWLEGESEVPSEAWCARFATHAHPLRPLPSEHFHASRRERHSLGLGWDPLAVQYCEVQHVRRIDRPQ